MTVIDPDPRGDEERRAAAVDLLLEAIRQRRRYLFEQVIAECKSDPRFLDRLLKELKPLRGKGGAKRSAADDTFIAIQAALGDEVLPIEIIQTIARTLHLSEPQARRLYYAARRKRGDPA